jgi:hypothetical protein
MELTKEARRLLESMIPGDQKGSGMHLYARQEGVASRVQALVDEEHHAYHQRYLRDGPSAGPFLPFVEIGKAKAKVWGELSKEERRFWAEESKKLEEELLDDE